MRGQLPWLSGLLFVMAACMLVALSVPIEKTQQLSTLAASLWWVIILLSSLISLPQLYQQDYEDGSLEQWQLLPMALELVVLAKCLAHWIVAMLPLVIATPIIAQLLLLEEGEALFQLAYSLAIGSWGITFISSMAAAMALGQRISGGVMGIIIFPLYLPIAIFGVSVAEPAALQMVAAQMEADMASTILIAIVVILCPISCFASAGWIRNTARV